MVAAVVFLRNLMDKHYCGLLYLMLWSFLCTVVDKQYCGEL